MVHPTRTAASCRDLWRTTAHMNNCRRQDCMNENVLKRLHVQIFEKLTANTINDGELMSILETFGTTWLGPWIWSHIWIQTWQEQRFQWVPWRGGLLIGWQLGMRCFGQNGASEIWKNSGSNSSPLLDVIEQLKHFNEIGWPKKGNKALTLLIGMLALSLHVTSIELVARNLFRPLQDLMLVTGLYKPCSEGRRPDGADQLWQWGFSLRFSGLPS